MESLIGTKLGYFEDEKRKCVLTPFLSYIISHFALGIKTIVLGACFDFDSPGRK